MRSIIKAAGLMAVATVALSGWTRPAGAVMTVNHEFVAKLNENNIRAFLEEMDKVANSADPTKGDAGISTYFKTHLADGGHFNTALHYEVPGQPAQDTTLALDKAQYIQGVAAGAGSMQDYSSSVDMQSADIAGDGKTAKVRAVTKETGKLATKNPQTGQVQLVPVSGQSSCDETIILSSNVLQLQEADCKTSFTLSP